jgi:hypothetical protein
MRDCSGENYQNKKLTHRELQVKGIFKSSIMSGDDEYSETTKLPRMAIKKPKKKSCAQS